MLVAPFKDAAVPPFDTWAKRFAWIKRYRGLSMSRLSLDAGLSRSTVGNAVRREEDLGKASFDSETIARLARTANVDVRWLSTGEGSPEPRSDVPTVPTDAWAVAAEMLVKHDGLSLTDALRLLRDASPDAPTIQGYYGAARELLARRAPADLGITKTFEEGLERELRGELPSSPVAGNKRKQTS